MTLAALKLCTLAFAAVAIITGICGAWACWRLSRDFKRSERKDSK